MGNLLQKAVAAHREGRIAEAESLYRAVLDTASDQPEAVALLGVVCGAKGDTEESLLLAERAAALDPAAARFHFYLGNARLAVEDSAGAVAAFRAALAIDSTFAEAWCTLGTALAVMKDWGEAEKAYAACVRLTPEEAAGWFALGVVLSRLERHEEALEIYEKTRALGIDWTILDNIAQTCVNLHQFDRAEEAFRKIIDVAGQSLPDDEILICDEAKIEGRHWHLALLELLRGDLVHGFARYRARFAVLPTMQRPTWGKNLWKGEDLSGKFLLLYDEQGFGDSLMLLRYLPLLKARGAKVGILVQKPLASYLRTCAGLDRVITRDEPFDPCFDFTASLFDLPYVFKTELATIPADVPYLPVPKTPPPVDFRVGVVWAGAPKHKQDARRSLPLGLFADLFSVTGVSFYNLTRDKRNGDEALLAQFPVVDLTPEIEDFAALADKIMGINLIITCDTATAHLAGGMGREVWVLLPFAPDWRWMTGRADSPWYPTARLFRQNTAGDWGSVVEEVKRALINECACHKSNS